MITQAKLEKILPGNKSISEWYSAIDLLPLYEINTDYRLAGFFSQTAHESLDYTALKENLNYSWQGLRKTFPKYFQNNAIAQQYQRQPEKIANRVYANRMGNGPESSGDGWNYRGRGVLQLTGKNNYKSFADSIGYDLGDVVEYLETIKGALESALYYWKRNNLNRFCDKQDNIGLTKAINGGLNGLDDRVARYNRYLKIIRA